MPKRKIDPATGKPQLTAREQRVIDEYIKNGGNGAQAAAAAGYTGARPDQAAYRVLNRPEVQRRIRERIAQSRVSADEIIGTLVSIMYGRPGDLYDESGEFSILVAKKNGADHLLKSISGTTRTIEATKTRPAQVVKSYRAQIHSPVQAATALSRILGINAKTLSHSPAHRPLTLGYRPQPTDFAEAIAVDFKVCTWLEDLIDKQMAEQGLSRDAVAEQLLQVRPEIAKYLRGLPEPGPLTPDPCPEEAIGQALDFILGLAANPDASPDNHLVLETYLQIQALMDEWDNGSVTSEAARDAITRINARLSDQQRQDLHRLQVQMLIHHNITEGHLSAENIAAIHQQAAELADLQSTPSPEFVDQCIAEHPLGLETRDSSSNVQTCQCANLPTLLAQDSGATTGSVEKTQLLSPFSSEPLEQQAALPSSAGQAAQDSGLQTLDSSSNVQTCERANVLTPAEAKYACIDRGYIFGCDNRYIDVIRNIMKNETLTDAQAIQEMRRERHRSQWKWDKLIEPCIADYAKMHPRLAGYTIPPLPPPLGALERYFRPQPQPPQPPGDGPIPESRKPRELRGS
jgi:hypothetical protein